jgi:hypothetical protein
LLKASLLCKDAHVQRYGELISILVAARASNPNRFGHVVICLGPSTLTCTGKRS